MGKPKKDEIPLKYHRNTALDLGMPRSLALLNGVNVSTPDGLALSRGVKTQPKRNLKDGVGACLGYWGSGQGGQQPSLTPQGRF